MPASLPSPAPRTGSAPTGCQDPHLTVKSKLCLL